jgi:hypothetical protein
VTLAVERFPVRVMVPDVWDHVMLAVDGGMTVAELKRQALQRSGAGRADPNEYVVKFRGGALLDEGVTLEAMGVPPNAAFIVVPRRRRPVQ